MFASSRLIQKGSMPRSPECYGRRCRTTLPPLAPRVPMLAKPQDLAMHFDGESLPRAAAVERERFEICGASVAVIPLQRDEVDDAGIVPCEFAWANLER